jgi:hypothetical protein
MRWPARGTLSSGTSRHGERTSLCAWAAALGTLSVLAAAPALAHHRQTPPIVALTTSGDTPLPRLVPPERGSLVLATPWGAGRRIVTLSPWRNRDDPSLPTVIADAGDHANPAIADSGRVVAFDSASDPLGLGLAGRQVVGALGGGLFPVSQDPTGTSENPSVDGVGYRIAFESTADLTGTGTPGVRQVFLRDRDGSIRQLSHGLGAARNVVLSSRRDLVLFESSSDPLTGANTGIAQIWFGDVDGDAPAPITAGAGPSTNPILSSDGRLVLFESTADLAGTQANTGKAQIFVYDTRTRTYARVTNEPSGCRLPSAHRVQRDYRIAYVCGGVPYFTMLRADERYLVPAAGGTTQRVIAAMGVHFVVVSTRADLLAGAGATPGNQVYLVNLYKRPAVPVPATPVTWFPRQGLSPL